jgi:hypothetical protein
MCKVHQPTDVLKHPSKHPLKHPDVSGAKHPLKHPDVSGAKHPLKHPDVSGAKHPLKHPDVSGAKHPLKHPDVSGAKHPLKQGLYRGYSKTEYMNKFPDDPLTFQMLYKDKGMATGKFIDSRFAGFTCVDGSNDREIQINGILLHICLTDVKPLNTPKKYISVKFNTDKYECAKTGKMVNPMLYRRLPLLEEEINRQIEGIVKGTGGTGGTGITKVAEVPFIEIDSHL